MRGDVAPPAYGICMKTERVDVPKMGGYIVRNCLHFFQKHAILPASKERLRGGGAADGGNPFRQRPGGNRPPDRQNSSSTNTTNTFSSNFPSPDRRRPEKQTAANRFPFLHLPRDGARTARGQSPHRRARPQQKVVMPMIVRK